MKKKHYALLICLVLSVMLASLYQRSKVEEASPPPPESIRNADSDGDNATAALAHPAPEEPGAEPAEASGLLKTAYEEREAYWERNRRRREEQIAESVALGQNPSPEAMEAYLKNFERRREEDRADIALLPPPDPRLTAWYPRYLASRSYEAPPAHTGRLLSLSAGEVPRLGSRTGE